MEGGEWRMEDGGWRVGGALVREGRSFVSFADMSSPLVGNWT